MNQEQKPPLDESFMTLCTIGILVLFDAVDLATIKRMFADAMGAVPFEDLVAMPEYKAAWDRVNAAGIDLCPLTIDPDEVTPCE